MVKMDSSIAVQSYGRSNCFTILPHSHPFLHMNFMNGSAIHEGDSRVLGNCEGQVLRCLAQGHLNT